MTLINLFLKHLFVNQSYSLIHGLKKWILCCCLVVKSCPIFCDPVEFKPPGSAIHWISQTRTLVSIVISFYRRCYWPMDWTCISHICRQVVYSWANWKAGYCVSRHGGGGERTSLYILIRALGALLVNSNILKGFFFFSWAVDFNSEFKIFSEWSVLCCSMWRAEDELI